MREADHKTWMSVFSPPNGLVLRHALPRSEYSTIFKMAPPAGADDFRHDPATSPPIYSRM
jgi:hypothetical protein